MLQRARQFYASQQGSATIWLARPRLSTRLFCDAFTLSAECALVRRVCAMCAMIVRELNDALVWLTIEGLS